MPGNPPSRGQDSFLSFDPTAAQSATTLPDFLLGALAAILIGAVIAAACSYRRGTSRGFQLTIIALPLAVQTVVTLVSGNVGAGIAVLGAFSLVRFRSMAGTPRDMATIFVSVACGVCVGMDCTWMGAALAVIFAIMLVAGEILPGHGRQVSLQAELDSLEAIKAVEDVLHGKHLKFKQHDVTLTGSASSTPSKASKDDTPKQKASAGQDANQGAKKSPDGDVNPIETVEKTGKIEKIENFDAPASATDPVKSTKKEKTPKDKESNKEGRCKVSWDLTLPNNLNPSDVLPAVLEVKGCHKATLGKEGDSEDM